MPDSGLIDEGAVLDASGFPVPGKEENAVRAVASLRIGRPMGLGQREDVLDLTDLD